MRVLLINPGSPSRTLLGAFGRVEEPFAPLGLAYLAAVLREDGHQVQVIDQFARKLPEARLADEIHGARPDLVGLSCLTPDVPDAAAIAGMVRRTVPEAKVLLGNLHATLFHDDLMERGIADLVVRGEGEVAVRLLATRLSRGESPAGIPGISTRDHPADGLAAPPDLDALPFPAWDLFPLERYQAPPLFRFRKTMLAVQASRGCPYECYFCCQNTMVPQVRRRRTQGVVDEIEHNLVRHGVDFFWFSDAIFPLSPRDGHAFAEEMTRRGLVGRVRWVTECRVDTPDAALLTHLRQAGLVMVIFGFEVGDEAILSRIKPGVTIRAARDAMAAARRAGVATLGLFMIGLPGETEGTIRRTIDLAVSLDPDYAKFNRAIPYPGSRFFDEVRGHLEPGEDLRRYNPWASGAGHSSLFAPAGISPARVAALQRRAMRRFYLRPGKALRLLLWGRISLRHGLRGALALLEGLLLRRR